MLVADRIGMAKTRKKTDETPQAAGDTAVASLDRERVALRAYELYLERGGADGLAMDDWLTAERELLVGGSPVLPPRDRSDES
jgi:hypothetical protein